MEAVIVTSTAPTETRSCFITIHTPPLPIPIPVVSHRIGTACTAATCAYPLGTMDDSTTLSLPECGSSREGGNIKRFLLLLLLPKSVLLIPQQKHTYIQGGLHHLYIKK
eukprot:8939881-Ditylum_brightwellii.AAC.1